jgi:hypothetical protein
MQYFIVKDISSVHTEGRPLTAERTTIYSYRQSKFTSYTGSMKMTVFWATAPCSLVEVYQ